MVSRLFTCTEIICDHQVQLNTISYCSCQCNLDLYTGLLGSELKDIGDFCHCHECFVLCVTACETTLYILYMAVMAGNGGGSMCVIWLSLMCGPSQYTKRTYVPGGPNNGIVFVRLNFIKY